MGETFGQLDDLLATLTAATEPSLTGR
jgi:hypothetical protein